MPIFALALLAAAAGRGSLELAFRETGSVFLDGRLLSTSLEGRFTIDEGAHSIRIVPDRRSYGCKPLDGYVVIEAGQTTDEITDLDGRVRRAPDHYLPGCVTFFRVGDEGSGAVELDGATAGVAGQPLESRAGPHRLILRDAKGNAVRTEIVDLHFHPSDDPERVLATAPGDRWIVSGDIPGALPDGKGALLLSFREFGYYYVDGIRSDDPTAMLRNKRIPMDPGPHDVTIVAADHASGCEALEGTVQIVAGKTTSDIVTAEGRTVRLEDHYLRGCLTSLIVQVPPGTAPMNVAIDDRPVGMTGRRLESTSGPHRLSLFRLSERMRVDLYSGAVDLHTSDAAEPQIIEVSPGSEPQKK